MGVATTLLAVSALANTGYSVYSAEKQRKEAKKLAQQENEALNEKKKEAEELRKNQIDSMRDQLVTGENKLASASNYGGSKGLVVGNLAKLG